MASIGAGLYNGLLTTVAAKLYNGLLASIGAKLCDWLLASIGAGLYNRLLTTIVALAGLFCSKYNLNFSVSSLHVESFILSAPKIG